MARTTVTASATKVTLTAASTVRTSLSVFNQSAVPLDVYLSGLEPWRRVQPFTSVEVPDEYTGAVQGQWPAASGQAIVLSADDDTAVSLQTLRVGANPGSAYPVEVGQTYVDVGVDRSVMKVAGTASRVDHGGGEFWGLTGIRVDMADDTDVSDTNDPYLVGFRARVSLKADRTVTAVDDVVGFMVTNKSYSDWGVTHNGTEAVYIGNGGDPANTKEWNTGVGVETAADNGMYITRGPYSYGILMTGASFTTAAIRFPNATKIVTRNAADSANIDLLQYDGSNRLLLGPTSGTIRTGIGQSAPAYPVDVAGSAVADSNTSSVLRLVDTTAFAAGTGGGISFSGYQDGSNNIRVFGAIRGVKANGTGGNAAGDLVLYSRDASSGIVERMRIDNLGVINVPAVSNTGGILQLNELSADAAAGAANTARLYAKDNGAGKTQLIARFATGAVVVLATEP